MWKNIAFAASLTGMTTISFLLKASPVFGSNGETTITIGYPISLPGLTGNVSDVIAPLSEEIEDAESFEDLEINLTDPFGILVEEEEDDLLIPLFFSDTPLGLQLREAFFEDADERSERQFELERVIREDPLPLLFNPQTDRNETFRFEFELFGVPAEIGIIDITCDELSCNGVGSSIFSDRDRFKATYTQAQVPESNSIVTFAILGSIGTGLIFKRHFIN